MPENSKKKSLSQEEMQELAVQYEMYRRELEAIDSQIKELQLRHSDLELTHDSVSAVEGRSGSEVLLPLGAGVYVRSQVSESKVCLVNIGANIIIEKPIQDALKMIKEQKERIMNTIVKLNDEAESFVSQMMEIEPQIMSQ